MIILTGKVVLPSDPAKPLNESKNNTVLRELPPAQPAFIRTLYAIHRDFPK
jgi:hypothetical protein